jgi:hypothetical protein
MHKVSSLYLFVHLHRALDHLPSLQISDPQLPQLDSLVVIFPMTVLIEAMVYRIGLLVLRHRLVAYL